MKLKLFFSLILLLPFFYVTNAQSGKEVAIGSKVPDVYIANLQNYSSTGARLSELYKGKLLLIEFWASYCGTCIGFMSQMDSLQQQFKEDLQVLTVTVENQASVDKVLERLPQIKKLQLAGITDDIVLYQLFPNKFVPHLVWIDSTGTLVATTSHEEATAENIAAFLKGGKKGLLTKRDNMTFDWRQPYKPIDSLIKYRSLLTTYDGDIGGGIAVFPISYFTDTVSRYFSWNSSLLDLFYTAYLQNVTSAPNMKRVILEVADSFQLLYPGERLSAAGYTSILAWQRRHNYVYERIQVGGALKKDFYAGMLQDLNCALPFEATIEERMLEGWVLKRSGKIKLPPSKEGHISFLWSDNQIDSIKGIKVNKLLSYLETLPGAGPFLDKTGYLYPLDLEVSLKEGAPIDFKALQEVLGKQGIKLRHEVRRFPVLVIRDKKGK